MIRGLLRGMLLTLALVVPASAQFDDIGDLSGETVVEAGNLKVLQCPINGNYNCLTWPGAFYRLGSYCVEAVGGYGAGLSQRGILTTNDRGAISIFVVGTISANFKKHPAKLYDCPSVY